MYASDSENARSWTSYLAVSKRILYPHMVSVPEAWNLVSIETHKDYRGKGHATEVTSSLVEFALRHTETVTVTVLKDNVPAIRTYEKVGFRFAEDRI